MIKGGSRGGAGSLAWHLLRADTNERVEVTELAGVAATTLPAALHEMAGVAAGTRCNRPLYHASINTAPGEVLTAAQKAHAIATLEKRLGLAGHPRAVIEHRKAGRNHLHVVWGRIDPATMRAVHDGHNYRKHEEVARQLEREFGHRRVPGAHAERETPAGERQPRPTRTLSAADVQQAARTGRDPVAITTEITGLWHAADSGKAFAAALHEAGYVLAQGEKRGFCVVDTAGGVHSLARRIEGVKTKEVTARLAGIELASLPTVDQARQQQRQQGAEKSPRDPVRVFAAVDPLPDPAPPGAPPQRTEGGPGIPVVPTTSTRPRAGRQHERVDSGGMKGVAPQRPSHAVKSAPIAAKSTPPPEKPGTGRSGSETLYSAGIRLARPAAGGSGPPAAAPIRSGIARAAGAVLGRLGGLFSGGGGHSSAGARMARPPAPVPIFNSQPRPEFMPRGGGCAPPPKIPVKGGPVRERPFARFLGPALGGGVSQEVIAWAMEAKKKLIAFSCETGADVKGELAHLGSILSGAYLEAGLTVTGKQRQSAGPPQ